MGRWIAYCIIALMCTGLAFSIGISPSKISEDHASRGSKIDKVIYLSGVSEGQQVNIKVSGDAAEWITTEKSLRFPDSPSMPLNIRIEVPEDAANGVYQASIHVSAVPAGTGNDAVSVTVVAAVKADISIAVSGQEHREYTIIGITVQPSEEGQPVRALIDIDNTGNVIAAPDHLDIIILDKLRKEALFQVAATDIQAVKPFTRSQSPIEINPGLGTGQYVLRVKAMDQGKLVHEAEIPFEILEKGSMKKSGKLISAVASDAIIGKQAKVSAVFENTGDRAVTAMLNAEIYQSDWLVESVSSKEMLVEPGEKATLSAYFTANDPGRYTAECSVSFEGKVTGIQAAMFEVMSGMPTGMAASGPIQGQSVVIMLGILAAGLIIGAAVKMRKR